MLSTPSSVGEDTCPTDGRDDHIKTRMLHEACVKLGGEHHLADYLGVSVGFVHAWLKGRGTPPDEIFLKCLDLLGE